MNWVPFNTTQLPPENIPLLVRLTTKQKFYGRNLDGLFHQYHPNIDRFIEVTMRPNDPWYAITHYCIIDDPV